MKPTLGKLGRLGASIPATSNIPRRARCIGHLSQMILTSNLLFCRGRSLRLILIGLHPSDSTMISCFLHPSPKSPSVTRERTICGECRSPSKLCFWTRDSLQVSVHKPSRKRYRKEGMQRNKHIHQLILPYLIQTGCLLPSIMRFGDSPRGMHKPPSHNGNAGSFVELRLSGHHG